MVSRELFPGVPASIQPVQMCPICGAAMRGVAFVDYESGELSTDGELIYYCVPCSNRRYPYTDVPWLKEMRERRVAARLSLRDLSRQIDVPIVTLSDYERGRLPIPGPKIRALWEAAIEEAEVRA